MKDKINLIDIGSLGGLDLPWSKHKAKVGKLLCFEPNEETIFHPDFIKYNTAIWNSDGVCDFHVSGRDGSGSSLLKQNFKWVEENFESIKNHGDNALNQSWFERSKVTEVFKVKVNKLDTVLGELRARLNEPVRFHFLKSDTQSGEGQVLQGAEDFLKNDCLGLELELFRYPLYENLIIDEDVKKYLEELNFKFVGWSGFKNSFHSQYDALFIKSTDSPEDERIIKLILDVYQPKGTDKIIKEKSFIDKLRRRITNLIK